MDEAQKEILCVLLGRLHALGLISKAAYDGGVDLVRAMKEIPAFFSPSAAAKEQMDGYSSGTP